MRAGTTVPLVVPGVCDSVNLGPTRVAEPSNPKVVVPDHLEPGSVARVLTNICASAIANLRISAPVSRGSKPNEVGQCQQPYSRDPLDSVLDSLCARTSRSVINSFATVCCHRSSNACGHP